VAKTAEIGMCRKSGLTKLADHDGCRASQCRLDADVEILLSMAEWSRIVIAPSTTKDKTTLFPD
jgi:hypothetical protein